MLRITILLLACLLAALHTTNSYAWGTFGHLTVCDLAYRNLTKEAKLALQDLMHSHDGGITVRGKGRMEDRHYTSFNLGCLEEDKLPRRNPEDHFINVSRDTELISGAACPGGGECILAGIQRDFETLRDTEKSDEDRVFALMALGHWVGDIHQPLHVSFADDRGGNSIDVDMKAKCGTSHGGKPKNLHAVWDNCLLEAKLFERVRQREDFKTTWGPRTITYRAVDSLQANTSLSEEKSFVGADPWTWAAESYAITVEPDVLYCTHEPGGCFYSGESETYSSDGRRVQPIYKKYLTTFSPVAQERIRRAGFRLADLINKALDPAYTGPIANSSQRP